MTSIQSSKINRFVQHLIPHAAKSNMPSKHAAMVVIGGKTMSIGHNHDRMTNGNHVILAYHAEIHALSNYFSNHEARDLRSYINDSQPVMSFRNNPENILKGAWVA